MKDLTNMTKGELNSYKREVQTTWRPYYPHGANEADRINQQLRIVREKDEEEN